MPKPFFPGSPGDTLRMYTEYGVLALKRGDRDVMEKRNHKNVYKVIDLGFCPRCKAYLGDMRVIKGVKFCWLCSFDVEADRMELQRWIGWAKDYAKNMM